MGLRKMSGPERERERERENCHNEEIYGLYSSQNIAFFNGATAPSGPRPPQCRGFTITQTHNTW